MTKTKHKINKSRKTYTADEIVKITSQKIIYIYVMATEMKLFIQKTKKKSNAY